MTATRGDERICVTGGVERLRGEPIVYSEGIYCVELNPGLQEWEVEDAWKIIRWLKGTGPFFGIAGIMLVSGPPRQGKGLFSNVLAWKVKRYFKFKHVLRDDQAPPPFGEFSLFNEDTVMADVNGMSELAETRVVAEARKTVDKANLVAGIERWKTDRGEVLLQDSVVLKDEFWKDMNKRRPMNPMNLIFGGFIKMWGHLDMLLLGIIQNYQDLDRFTCLPFVSHHAKCMWCATLPNTTQVDLYHVRWNYSRQQLVPIDKHPTRIFLDGGKERPELGGKRYFDLFTSKTAPNLKNLGRAGFRGR